jgi:hypothetical protein
LLRFLFDMINKTLTLGNAATRSFMLGLLFTGCVLSGCNKNKNTERADNPPVVNNSNTAGGPQFKKEGELWFLKSDSVIVYIDIEIADTPAEQQQGLMDRTSMLETQGMLFIFNVEKEQGFWMKNTILPLDIIYINSKKEIVSIQKNAQPYSLKNLPSGLPAQYVVETIAGFSDMHALKPGDRADWKIL